MHRLQRVKREVSDELCSRGRSAAAAQGDPAEAGDGDLDDEVLEEEERAALMTSSLELKDVFSLARYHERVLDRMLSTCFLKSKQAALLAIVNDLLQTVLDFSQLCLDFHTPWSTAVEPPTFDDFNNLHRYFRSRLDVLIQALAMLKDRSPTTTNASNSAALPDDMRGETAKRRLDVEAEKLRLVQEQQQDLRTLDVDREGRSVQERERQGVASVEVLLVRLNASGFYADLG